MSILGNDEIAVVASLLSSSVSDIERETEIISSKERDNVNTFFCLNIFELFDEKAFILIKYFHKP
jgi:hypothetical protein